MNAQTDLAVAAPTAPESASVLSIIGAASRDANVDVDKLERLLAMQERIVARNAELAFNEAMTAAQSEMGPVSADATNPQTHSKYASYAKLDHALRPIYVRHGFSLSFGEDESPKPEHVRVVCHVSHRLGHSRTYHKDMPADGKGAKGGDVMTKTHAVGAAQSYGMRYLLKGIFNVAIGEEDIDGNDPRPTITSDQVAKLKVVAMEVGADKDKFLRLIKVRSLEEIPAASYDMVLGLLEAKRRNRGTTKP